MLTTIETDYTAEEFELIEAGAEASGMTVRDFLRAADHDFLQKRVAGYSNLTKLPNSTTIPRNLAKP